MWKKARKRANKPSDLVEKEVALAEDGKTAGKAAIEATTSFRRDQQRAALARYSALSKAAKVEPEELTGRDRSWKRRKTSIHKISSQTGRSACWTVLANCEAR